jgi:hypothetical protein
MNFDTNFCNSCGSEIVELYAYNKKHDFIIAIQNSFDKVNCKQLKFNNDVFIANNRDFSHIDTDGLFGSLISADVLNQLNEVPFTTEACSTPTTAAHVHYCKYVKIKDFVYIYETAINNEDFIFVDKNNIEKVYKD